jgi:hypothetical protein
MFIKVHDLISVTNINVGLSFLISAYNKPTPEATPDRRGIRNIGSG